MSKSPIRNSHRHQVSLRIAEPEVEEANNGFQNPFNHIFPIARKENESSHNEFSHQAPSIAKLVNASFDTPAKPKVNQSVRQEFSASG